MSLLRIIQGRVLEWTASLLTILITGLVFLQVINRYIFNNPLSWTEEASRIIFIWITFLGAFLALKSKTHISFGSFVDRYFATGTRRIISNVVNFFILFFLFYLIGVGIEVLGKEVRETTTPALDVSYSFIYSAIPLSAAMMVPYLIRDLYASKWKTVTSAGIIFTAIMLVLYLLFGGERFSAGNPILLAVVCLAIQILFGMPIAFSLGLTSLIFLILQGKIPLLILHNRMVGGIDSFPLLAVPFFVLAGELMNTGGITQRLVDFAKVLVGHLRGGLGMVVVVGEYFFSGISGSTVADVSAIGSMMIPGMKKAGFKSEDAVAIVSAASAMGILVPPCIPMVVLGGMTGISIAALFLGGFVPAVVLALCIMALIYIKAVRADLSRQKRLPLREVFKSVVGALIPLMMPIIICGAIISGATTATEVAVIAVVYSFLVGIFIYREIRKDQIIPILVRTVTITGTVMFLVGTSSVLSWIFAMNQVPQKIGGLISIIAGSPWVFPLIIDITFILLGAVLEGLPAMIILVPIFTPHVSRFGMDPLHFGILVIASLGIGIFMPPIGIGMYIACSFAEIDIGRAVRPYMPFLLTLFIGLIIISYFPWFSLVLPNIFLPNR
ncbi:MAG: TRAP transporter large permease subunit [Thermodesulfobacteriota bacterium]|jgi:tripartite ATP-independent transporter DctM subunit